MTPQQKADRAAIVDEYGELQRQLEAIAPVQRKAEKLAAEIRSWYADSPAGEAYTEHGTIYDVQVGERQNKRSIKSMAKVYSALGKARFLEICSVTMKALEGAIAPDRLGDFVEQERTGTRELRAVARVGRVMPAAVVEMPSKRTERAA